ncbi:MAG: hypothetical protein WC477_07760 [Patescibacteria group bacterium]
MGHNDNVSPAAVQSVEALGLLNAVKNFCHSYAGLVIGTGSAAKVKLTNATDVSVKGQMFQLDASAEVAFTATTHDITADANTVQEAVYLVVVDYLGAASLYMGEIATGSGNAEIPKTPEGYAVIGYVRVAVEAGSTDFDASSDELSASHLTDTYVNLSCNPADFDQG